MILEAQSDLDVVGEAADGNEAVELARSLQPDVILMDIRMPNLDGIEATKRIVIASPRTRVMMLTTFGEDGYVWQAMKAGASAFLLKDVPPEDLAVAVRTVARGDALLGPEITRRLIEDFIRGPKPGSLPTELGDLTDRETEVLVLLARGLSNGEIAKQLYLGETTIKTHVNPDPRKARPPRPRTSRRARLRERPRTPTRRVAWHRPGSRCQLVTLAGIHRAESSDSPNNSS